MKTKSIYMMLLVFLFWERPAKADWTLNLGYHNPPGALVGVNFLYIGSQWGVEFGVGWIDVDSQDKNNDEDNQDDTVSAKVGGDFNVKYFLSSGRFKPYLQGGIGLGVSTEAGEDTDASAGAGGLFGGLGLMIGSKSLYVYGAYNVGQGSDGFVQAGIGFDI